MTYQARYYDTTEIETAIDSAGTIGDMYNATDDMEVVYGFNFVVWTTTGDHPTTAYATWSGFRIMRVNSDWPAEVLNPEHFKVIILELSKWPPAIVDSILDQVALTERLTDSTLTDDYSGVTVNDSSNRIVIDMSDAEAGMDSYGTYIPGYASTTARTLHHELQHRMKYKLPSATPSESEWTALNVIPYGSQDPDGDPTTRPEGYTRNYGMTSFTEDIAEVFSFLMYTPTYWAMQEWRKTDAALDGKINLMNEAVASATDNQMGTQGYYDAIHGTSNPYAGVEFLVVDGGSTVPALPYLWQDGELKEFKFQLAEQSKEA